jgi:flagellar biosynthesis GTPase FlhF
VPEVKEVEAWAEWLKSNWGFLATIGAALGGAWVWVRGERKQARKDVLEAKAEGLRLEAEAKKNAAELRRQEVETDAEEDKANDAEARAADKRRQEKSDWAVEQARKLFEETKRQVEVALHKVDRAVRAETRCRVLVATLYVQIREMQKRLKIDRTDPTIDAWVQDVLNPKDGNDAEDTPREGHPDVDHAS